MKTLGTTHKTVFNTTTVFTIGHSTLPIEEFIAILTEYGIRLLADIRTVPRSRHNPQFNADTLPVSLAARGIEYQLLKDLGGLRRTHKHSINTAWQNNSFRGYADYMQTEEFETALTELIELTAKYRVAIMCAEAVPWRCHRRLVADALAVRGIRVVEIMGLHSWREHTLTPFAHVEGYSITYPG